GTTLAGTENDWLEEFARRASAINKGHRHSLRQALNDGGCFVSFLYGGIGAQGGNTFEGSARALQDLELSVAKMSQTCRILVGIQNQLEELYAANLRQNMQISWKRTLVLRRALNNVKTLSKYVRKEEQDICGLLDRWRPSFLLVSRPECHAQALEAIRAQKIDRQGFRQRVKPLFSALNELSREKTRLLEEVEALAEAQQSAWMERKFYVIAASEVNEALSKYGIYRQKLAKLRAKQELILQDLQNVACLCRQSPSHLPGPYGCNIPIIDVMELAANFASVRFRAAHTTQTALSVIEDLKKVL
ncbi:hypothetical protein C8T65DRAFT_697449, partial [Cerioporus squamosus]